MELKALLALICLLGLVTGEAMYDYIVSPGPIPLTEVNDYYMSATLDITNLSTVDFSNEKLIKLVNHIGPMYLRIGGTEADIVVFRNDSTDGNRELQSDEYILTGSRWLQIQEFASKAGVVVIYDLNSLLRNSDGSWNSTNAEQLIEFSAGNGFELHWELGNEPDLYNAIYKTQVNASQLAEDYKNLRSIIDKYQSNSFLIGPSMFDVGGSSSNQDFLKNFVAAASSYVDAVTWHQYYFSAHEGTEEKFMSPSTLNYFEQRTKAVTNIVGTANRIWLGETSSAYQGGTPGMSDRFLASFMWLDKLGLGATLGINALFRQSIWVNNYSLLDIDYNPNPDWWVSVLYRQFVGVRVLSLYTTADDERTIRLYVHCSKPREEWGMTGAVTVFGINVANSTGTFRLRGFQANDTALMYQLTSDSLLSKNVYLNGELLALTDDHELPEFNATTVPFTDEYAMPAHSIAFWVFTGTNVAACK